MDSREGRRQPPPGLRDLPSVQALIENPLVRSSTSLRGPALTAALRDELDQIRHQVLSGAAEKASLAPELIASALAQRERPRLSPVINATGIIIHTNLGRAPVSDATANAMAAAAGAAVPLEIDPATNLRGGRMREITSLM